MSLPISLKQKFGLKGKLDAPKVSIQPEIKTLPVKKQKVGITKTKKKK